jgi:large subunit ribosomal protein L23
MADLKYYDVIQKPLVTDKSMEGMGDKRYVFKVHPESNKIQIREAIEKMFDGVKVDTVRTMNYDGKIRRRGRTSGRTAAYKKAIITLKTDSKEIDIFQGM